MGCQCLKPTFALSRRAKRSVGFGLAAALEELLREGWDGGDSSTPSFTRWLWGVLVLEHVAVLVEFYDYPLTAGIVFSRFCDSSFFFKPSA
jgi:hypothetical protein